MVVLDTAAIGVIVHRTIGRPISRGPRAIVLRIHRRILRDRGRRITGRRRIQNRCRSPTIRAIRIRAAVIDRQHRRARSRHHSPAGLGIRTRAAAVVGPQTRAQILHRNRSRGTRIRAVVVGLRTPERIRRRNRRNLGTRTLEAADPQRREQIHRSPSRETRTRAAATEHPHHPVQNRRLNPSLGTRTREAAAAGLRRLDLPLSRNQRLNPGQSRSPSRPRSRSRSKSLLPNRSRRSRLRSPNHRDSRTVSRA